MSQKIKVDQIADLSATAAQLNFTVGVTASIQTQLDAKLAKAGGTMTGNIVFASGQPFSASDLNSGTLPDARFPSALPAISGANLTNLPAGGIASVAADTSPQLGGNLDVVTHDIVSTSNRNIDILPDGSGKVNLDGDGSSGGVSVSDGLVDIRTGTGSRSQVKFYCEVNNAHAQTIQPQPHSASVTNTLTLPAGGNQELVGTTATQTLTNKSIAASQLTGALPAISGASLTNLPAATEAPKLVEECTNSRGAQIPQMVAVYAKNKQGTRLGVDVAHYQQPATMPAVGITPSAISAGQNGDVVTQGLISGLDTSSFTLGDTLYVSAAGNLTATKPTGNLELTQAIAKVTNVNASTGEIYVFGPSTFLTNNLEGYLIDGYIYIGDSSNEVSLISFASAANNAGLATSSTLSNYMPLSGGTFTGDVRFNGANYDVLWDVSARQLEFEDNAYAVFGAGDDLLIGHTAAYSKIHHQGQGNLYIAGDDITFVTGDLSETKANFNTNAGVELFHNNVKKFETTSAGATVTGTLAATALTGDGSGLTNLPVTTSASDLTSGTLADARFPATLPAISGANLTNLPVTTSASDLTSGTLPDARFPSVLPAISGANLTNLPSPTPHTESVGSISGSTLNLASGNIFSHAPSSNTTYVFSSPPASGTAIGFTLKVSPSATVTLTWPTSVDWPGGAAPAAPASGQTDVFTFYTQDGGTTYYGFQAGNAMG